MLDRASSDKGGIHAAAAFYQNAVNLPLSKLPQDLGNTQAVFIFSDSQNCHACFFQERLPVRAYFFFIRIRRCTSCFL